MGVSVSQDLKYNSDQSGYVIDMSGWDYAIVQIINSLGETIDFYSTNDGNENNPQNLVQIFGTSTIDGLIYDYISGNNIIKFENFGRYIWLTQNPVDAIKLQLYKIG